MPPVAPPPFDDAGSLRLGVLDQPGHVLDLAGFRERRDAHALVPGHADLQLGEFLREPLQEAVDDRLVHDQHLERRAALAVERQRTQQALLYGEIDVGVRQDDRGILGVKPEDGPQAVHLGMHLLEVIGDLAGADQGEDVDLARLQQHRDNLRAFAVDGVDDALRKGASKGLQQRREEEHAELRRLEHHGVAHDEAGISVAKVSFSG